MKIIVITCALLIATLSSYGQAADYLLSQDNRSVNEVPTFFKRKLSLDFKDRSIIGVPGTGIYSALLTIAPWADNSGGKNHQLSFSESGVFYRGGSHLSSTWESWRKLVIEDPNGNVGIGTASPTEKLSINGKVRAHEIKVEIANWPDYVFTKDYALPSLQETEDHIREKGHLPGIPSAAEVQANGVELGEMNKKLLQKIEELTLYLIEMKKDNDNIKKENETQKEDIKYLKSKNQIT